MPEFHYDISGIEQLVRSFLPHTEGMQRTVVKAMDEAVENGGKRVRPILMYESCKCFAEARGEAPEVWTPDVAPFMAAMEMIHTFSLIHDDLPCMDNDTLRRGKPTTWYSYGEDMATLAGDALSIEAFSVAAKGILNASEPGRAAKALDVLAEKSGIRGMIGGQTADVEKTGKPLTGEELSFIYRLKTAALIEGSVRIGAILGGASEEEEELSEEIGRNIGLAFQIRDDILDETSTEEVLGKPIHSDEKNLKTTYVTLYGLAEAERKADALSEEALKMLSSLPGNTDMLGKIIVWLTGRKN